MIFSFHVDTGMENPCMNFISSATLVGDRSLTSVIVHELTHSWTGIVCILCYLCNVVL